MTSLVGRVLVLVAIPASAIAEPRVCATEPRDAKPRGLQVVLKDGVLVPAGDGEFPAISSDGRRITHLFVDRDGKGATVTTVEIWEVSGPKEIGYESIGGTGFDKRATDIVVRTINEKLAGTWKPIPIYKPCDPKGTSVQLAAGLAFTIKPRESDTLVTRSIKGTEAIMRLRLEPIGTTAGTLPDGGGGEQCGPASRIAFAFGGLAEGIAVLVPAGDRKPGCFPKRTANSANPYLMTGTGG